jgi:hypothetical protein
MAMRVACVSSKRSTGGADAALAAGVAVATGASTQVDS